MTFRLARPWTQRAGLAALALMIWMTPPSVSGRPDFMTAMMDWPVVKAGSSSAAE